MRLEFAAIPGKIAVQPVVIRKKGGLVVAEARSPRKARIGRVVSEGCEAFPPGMLVMYRGATEEKLVYHGIPLWFVAIDDVECVVEAEDDELIDNPLEVDTRTGVDDGWYGR